MRRFESRLLICHCRRRYLRPLFVCLARFRSLVYFVNISGINISSSSFDMRLSCSMSAHALAFASSSRLSFTEIRLLRIGCRLEPSDIFMVRSFLDANTSLRLERGLNNQHFASSTCRVLQGFVVYFQWEASPSLHHAEILDAAVTFSVFLRSSIIFTEVDAAD